MSEVLVITGPTASGKSAVAIQVAEERGGEIINADAMQVYSDLRVLTARPSPEDEARVPHHLYGTVDGSASWSAGIYARQAVRVIERIHERGGIPILVGGTGLWLKALTTGLSPIPAIPDSVLRAGELRLEELGQEGFHREVLNHDPEMDWLKPADRQRHLRAWSVYVATGKALSEWQKEPPLKLTDASFRTAVLQPPREQLYARCDARLHAMVECGALAEVEALLALNLPGHLPVMKAVGVPELAAHIRGEVTLSEAIAMAQQSTRRLAKRQMTWFRGQMPDWPVYQTPDELLASLSAD